MALSMASNVLCLGCGAFINNSSDRRNLWGSSSKTVSSTWKSLLKAEFERRGWLTVFECLFTVDGIRTKNYGSQKNMCRKCFYLYEKTHKSQEVAMYIYRQHVYNFFMFCFVRGHIIFILACRR